LGNKTVVGGPDHLDGIERGSSSITHPRRLEQSLFPRGGRFGSLRDGELGDGDLAPAKVERQATLAVAELGVERVDHEAAVFFVFDQSSITENAQVMGGVHDLNLQILRKTSQTKEDLNLFPEALAPHSARIAIALKPLKSQARSRSTGIIRNDTA
jgi:hypothetical protein